MIPPLQYNPSQLVTGSFQAKPGEFVLRDFNGPIQYIGPYFYIQKTGAKEYYTGLEPNAPDNELRSSNSKNLSTGKTQSFTSNHPLVTFGEVGLTTTSGKFEPKKYDISSIIKLEYFYNGYIPRFFARRIIDNVYRETDYTSFTNIKKRNADWDYKNWEVKEVFGGWGINYFFKNPTQFKTITGTPELPLYNNLYTENKIKILAIDKGETFNSSLSIGPTLGTSGISSKDENSTNPWPGFKEWYCNRYGINFEEKYFTLQSQDGIFISNDKLNNPLTVSKPSTVAKKITYYNQDTPTIPLRSRYYLYNNQYSTLPGTTEIGGANKIIGTPRDVKAFLYLATPIINDVNPATSTTLDVKKVYSPDLSITREYNKNTLCNISEIFLRYPSNKSNPNSQLQKNPPKLINPKTKKEHIGPFCKDFDGNYWDGLVPPNGFNDKIAGDTILKAV